MQQWHDLYLRECLSASPKAKLYGAPTIVRWNRALPFTEVLGDLAPSLWTDEIDACQIFLRMRQLQDAAAPQARRLLRLLFLRFGEMSTNAGRELHQLRN
jgi:hypothetical protein